MNNQRITVESKVFKKVDRLYPGTQVAIVEAWKKGHGWIPFLDLLKTVPGYLMLLTSMIKYLEEQGFTSVQLELYRNDKFVARADYRIAELN